MTSITVWLSFYFLSSILNKYVRKYLNPIIDKDDNGSKQQITLETPYAILFIGIILFIIVINVKITNNNLTELYKLSISIAITIIGFLFAFQGILSSASFKTNSELDKYYEFETINGILKGLEGILRVFLALFIVSVLGLFIIYSFDIKSGIEFNDDTLFHKSIFSYSKDYLTSIVCFVLLLCFLPMAFTALFQLFLMANLIITPLKSLIKNKPLNVLEAYSYDAPQKLPLIEKAFLDGSQFNGMLLKSINYSDETSSLTCSFYLISPDKNSIKNLIDNIGEKFWSEYYERNSTILFEEIRIAGFRNGNYSKVFQITLTKNKYKFLTKTNDLSWDYKFELCDGSIYLIDNDRLL